MGFSAKLADGVLFSSSAWLTMILWGSVAPLVAAATRIGGGRWGWL